MFKFSIGGLYFHATKVKVVQDRISKFLGKSDSFEYECEILRFILNLDIKDNRSPEYGKELLDFRKENVYAVFDPWNPINMSMLLTEWDNLIHKDNWVDPLSCQYVNGFRGVYSPIDFPQIGHKRPVMNFRDPKTSKTISMGSSNDCMHIYVNSENEEFKVYTFIAFHHITYLENTICIIKGKE